MVFCKRCRKDVDAIQVPGFMPACKECLAEVVDLVADVDEPDGDLLSGDVGGRRRDRDAPRQRLRSVADDLSMSDSSAAAAALLVPASHACDAAVQAAALYRVASDEVSAGHGRGLRAAQVAIACGTTVPAMNNASMRLLQNAGAFVSRVQPCDVEARTLIVAKHAGIVLDHGQRATVSRMSLDQANAAWRSGEGDRAGKKISTQTRELAHHILLAVSHPKMASKAPRQKSSN